MRLLRHEIMYIVFRRLFMALALTQYQARLV